MQIKIFGRIKHLKKLTLLILILVIAMSISGCYNEDSNKAVLIKGIEKQEEIKTFTYDGSLNFKLDFSQTADSMITGYLNELSDLSFIFSGQEVVDSQQSEIELNISTEYQGQEITADIPIVFKDNRAYLKLPDNFDYLLQMGDKEYIALDLNQTNGETNREQALEDKTKLLKSIVNGIDEKAISKEDAKEYPLVEGTTSEVISINITQDNYKKVLAGIFTEAGPNIIKLLDSYSITESQKEQTEQLKAKLSDKEELSKLIKDIDDKILINNFKLTNVYDEEGYQRKTILLADLNVYVEELGQVGIKIIYDINIKEINEEIIFNLPIPSQNIIKELN